MLLLTYLLDYTNTVIRILQCRKTRNLCDKTYEEAIKQESAAKGQNFSSVHHPPELSLQQ